LQEYPVNFLLVDGLAVETDPNKTYSTYDAVLAFGLRDLLAALVSFGELGRNASQLVRSLRNCQSAARSNVPRSLSVGASVEPPHLQVKKEFQELFQQYAPLWQKEEEERANLWDSFLGEFNRSEAPASEAAGCGPR
jgi:hypothetical protein